jgi:nucleotidyltransferase substrate binding protein (TIGR01987 family)
MKLDTTSLKDAIRALDKATQTFDSLSKNKTLTPSDLETVKSGVIQNFEVAYEQCWKFMKRWLETNISPDSADGVSRRELYRMSAENKLIDSVDKWMDFHISRNLTSHTYSEYNAEIAFRSAMTFLPVAKEFLSQIESRND